MQSLEILLAFLFIVFDCKAMEIDERTKVPGYDHDCLQTFYSITGS